MDISIFEIKLALFQFKHSISIRASFYETLKMMLEDGIGLNDSLRHLYAIESDFGRKTRDTKALFINHCITMINAGKSLSHALKGVLSHQEFSLLKAGEDSNKLPESINEIIKMIEVKRKIFNTVFSAITYPFFLSIGICVLLYIVAYKIIPVLSKISPPSSWNITAKILNGISSVVINYGVYAVFLFLFILIASIYSLPRWRGKIRQFFDQIPPWSIYRTIHGASFLTSLSMLLKSGVTLSESLKILREGASPWLSERLDSIIYAVSYGKKSFGDALYFAGYNFPEKKAVRYLMALSDVSDLETILKNYSTRWTETSLQQISQVGKLIFIGGIIAIVILILLIFFGVQGMSSSIQNM